MPKIVRTSGLTVTDEVVKIRDASPTPAALVKKRPPAPAVSGQGTVMFEEELAAPMAPPQPQGEEEFAYGDYVAEPGAPLTGAGASIKEEIVNGAMSEASRILEDALRRAEQEKNAVLAHARQEAEEIRRTAAAEGHREGMTAALDTVRDSAAQLQNAIAAFEGERAGFEAEYDQQLRWLAIEIASKVLAKKVNEDDSEMLEMVDKAVQSVRGESWIRIEVAQEMIGLIDRLSALFEEDEAVTVSPVPAERGTVMIETPSGVVDASLHTQLANLREYFAHVNS